MPIERLQAFYRQWYQPDNATLVVAGRIDPATTLAKVAQAFGKLRKPARALPVAYTAEPTQDGEREVSVRRSGDIRVLLSAYHVPSVNHADSAAMAVLVDVLGDTPSGRLHKALVETKLAAATATIADSLREAGMVSLIAVAPRDADGARLEAELLRQAEQLAATPITADEVKLAQLRIANAFERNFTNVNAVATGLTEAVAAGDWRLYFLRRDAVAAVTVDAVNRVARAYLKPSNRTLGRFVPTDNADRADIPAAPSVASLLAGYTGKAAVAAGETFAVTATFRFGDEAALRSRVMAATFAGQLLMHGSATMTREQIAQRLEALKTEGGISGGMQSAAINLTSRRDTLPEALTLAAQLLRTPTFPESEFEQMRVQMVTGLEAARKEPGTVAGEALSRRFDPWPAGHTLAYRPLEQTLADVKAIKLDDVRAFHRDFYGTAQGEIAIVGDFDAAAVKQQLETLFVGWATPRPYAPIRTAYHPVAAEVMQLQTPDKANAVVLARGNLALNDTDADYPALMVANHVLGSSALASRLGDRLRQKEGLTYGVSSSISADSSPDGKDNAGSLNIQAIAAPQNVARLETGLREELARLVKDGITANELKDAVDGLLTQRAQSRAADGPVAGTLSRNLFLGRTMAWTADFDAQLRALTLEQVNTAIRKHIQPGALSVYKAGDFAKAATATPAPPAAAN